MCPVQCHAQCRTARGPFSTGFVCYFPVLAFFWSIRYTELWRASIAVSRAILAVIDPPPDGGLPSVQSPDPGPAAVRSNVSAALASFEAIFAAQRQAEGP